MSTIARRARRLTRDVLLCLGVFVPGGLILDEATAGALHPVAQFALLVGVWIAVCVWLRLSAIEDELRADIAGDIDAFATPGDVVCPGGDLCPCADLAISSAAEIAARPAAAGRRGLRRGVRQRARADRLAAHVGCPACRHAVGKHWPDDERQKPGCHTAGCLCPLEPDQTVAPAQTVDRTETTRMVDQFRTFDAPTMLHGTTHHGHPCCALATDTRHSGPIAKCGGPAICRSCHIDAAGIHGYLSREPDTYVGNPGGDQ